MKGDLPSVQILRRGGAPEAAKDKLGRTPSDLQPEGFGRDFDIDAEAHPPGNGNDEQVELGGQFRALDLDEDKDSGYDQSDSEGDVPGAMEPTGLAIDSFTHGDEGGSGSGIIQTAPGSKEPVIERSLRILSSPPSDTSFNASKNLREAASKPVDLLTWGISVPNSQSSVQAPTYASEQEELDAIRARIRRAPFMTSIPQCKEPSVGSSGDHYTGGRGITGKSIFTAFIKVLASGEYQCIQCGCTYKKLERAIGDQARHFGFKSYICEQKHDGKTVW